MKGKSIVGFVFVFAAFCSLQAKDRIVVRQTKPVVRTVHVVKTQPMGVIDINTNRKKAKVYVNGSFVGNAGAYDGFPGKLNLKPGTYRIKLVSGKKVVKRRVKVTANAEVNLNIKF